MIEKKETDALNDKAIDEEHAGEGYENGETIEPKQGELPEGGIPLDKDALKKVREEAKEAVLEDSKLTKEQREIWDQIVAEAQMPIHLSNKDFKLGPQELDIRNLSQKNILQMLFRVGVIDNIYLKQLLNVGLDIIRLLMVIADKLGVENISKATDEVLEKEKAANGLDELKVGEKEKTN